MEELFVAPLHYGFVIFGWLALAVMGTLTQTFYSFAQGGLGQSLCEAVDEGLIAK
jgi:methane/ammonia monooxygenase subunit C